MPFWCNDTTIGSLFRRTTAVQRFAVSFALIFLPPLSFIFFYYLPTASQIKNLSQRHKTLTQQAQSLNEICAKLKVFEQENKILLDQMNSKFKKVEPSEFMMSLVQRHELECSTIKPLALKKHDLIKKSYFTTTIKGLFKNCVAMLDELEKSEVPIKICEFKMYKWKARKIKFDLVFRHVSIDS